MELIAAVSQNWGLGLGQKLLFSIPEDHHRFRELTWGHPVLMGRRTLDSLPRGQALPGRRNIVLTRFPDFRRENVEVCHRLEELDALELESPFVIGGGEIYALLLPRCTTAHITFVDAAPPADVFFPNLDQNPNWALTWESEPRQWEALSYTFRTYRKK